MAPTALVTGAAGGIGRATVEAFVEHGRLAVGVDRRESNDFPNGARFWLSDLQEPGVDEILFKRLEGEIGRLDALINNAAIQIAKPILETTLEEWDVVQQVNLRVIFQLCQRAYPLLRATRGAIVNVSSVHAIGTSPQIATYAASKGGLLALTRAMALEFGLDGVRVNSVVPGAVETEMLKQGLERDQFRSATLQEKLNSLSNRIALGRIGQPSEVAQAILFLADAERSSYITGAALSIDGGALARLSTE